jgi:hypothetical protein
MADGRWAPWYDHDDVTQAPYGDETTYRLGADWLGDRPVEDWGCGRGWARRHLRGPYTGVDGTPSRWADVVADLTVYRSVTPALFMRHVLEHNDDWRTILANAIGSFTDRMFLAVFSPPGHTAKIHTDDLGAGEIPVWSIAHDDLAAVLDGHHVDWTHEEVVSATFYGREQVWRLSRS